MVAFDMSSVSVILSLISYQSWLEIGLGVSIFFNIVFGMLLIGILFPSSDSSQIVINRDLKNIAIGGLFAFSEVFLWHR
jgi:hypothetical protein